MRLKIREEIRRLVKEVGITTIFVTHDQEEALSISDKIILLNEGVIQQNDEPQNLYLEPNNLFVAQFIGNPIINLLSVEVKDGKMYHKSFEIPLERFEQARFKMPMTDGKYTFASRPEDVVPAETGLFTTTTDLVELIGRERILRFTLGNEQVKSIVSVEEAIEEGDTLSFDFSYKKYLSLTKRETGFTNEKYNPENQPKAWLFLLPSLGIILLFSVYPLFRSLWMSFQKGSLTNATLV